MRDWAGLVRARGDIGAGESGQGIQGQLPGICEGYLCRGLTRTVGGDGLKKFLRLILFRCWLAAAFCGHRRLSLFLRHLFLIDFRRCDCGRGIEHETGFKGDK